MFQLTEDERHHEPAVQRGIFLCPAYCLNIVLEVLCSFRQVGEVFIVAPDREQSAASHALTLNRPLRVHNIDKHTIAVDGTPTDCVLLSIMGLLDRKPDLVISGINSGPNLCDDVIYSG